MGPAFAWAMAEAASAHEAATATHEETSQQRAGRTRRTSANPQRAQQGATAAAAASPAVLDSLSRLQQLADASPQVAQLQRLQALADGRFAPVAQLAGGPEEEVLIQGKFAAAQLQSQLQQAHANATGDRIAFAEAPELHTAVHEAAHVVQQRASGLLQSGVGQSGDAYEQHADRVPDLVVAGRSAESELDAGPAGASAQPVVQCKLIFNKDTDYLNINGSGKDITVQGYRQTLTEAEQMISTINVYAERPKLGVAVYIPDDLELKGCIHVAPLESLCLKYKTKEYYSTLIAMAHETRHGIDDITKKVKFRQNNEEKIRTEWRAFATQSAVAMQLHNEGQKFDDRFIKEMAAFASKDAFMNEKSPMVNITASYLKLYDLSAKYSEDDAIKFMQSHESWVIEAIELFKSLFPPQLERSQVEALRPSSVGTDWTSKMIVAAVMSSGIVLAALAHAFGFL